MIYFYSSVILPHINAFQNQGNSRGSFLFSTAVEVKAGSCALFWRRSGRKEKRRRAEFKADGKFMTICQLTAKKLPEGQMEKVFLRVWKERSDGVGLREKNFQEGFYHRLLLEGDKHRCIRHRHVERSVQAASKQVALPASQHIHYILMQRRWVNAKIWVMLRKKTKKTKLQDWQITYRKHRWDSRKSITTTHRLAQKWQTVTVRKQHRNG